MIIENDTLNESVFLGSGEGLKCESLAMKGIFHWQDYSGKNGYGNLVTLGCTGCPAFTPTACGLDTHYNDSGNAGSYNVDNGKRMPEWERLGKDPNANYWE